MKYFTLVFIPIMTFGCISDGNNKLNVMIVDARDSLFYKELAEFTIQSIPESVSFWDSAILNINIQPGTVGLYGHFYEKGTKEWLELGDTWETIEGIIEFHERMTRDGTSKWNRMEFKLTNNMKFKNNFIWDTVYQAEVDKSNKETEAENPNYKRPSWPWEKKE